MTTSGKTPPGTLPPKEMRKIVRKHIQLWKTASHAEWRSCFTPEYTIEDPVGTNARPMGSYLEEWNNMHATDLRLDMEPYRLVVGGNEIVADLRAVTHLPQGVRGPDIDSGRRSTLSYTGIYTVDQEGQLSANRTFADPVPDELWKAFYPMHPLPSELPPPPLGEGEIRQAIEDHLYFWNLGSLGDWRARFSAEARIEDPVGRDAKSLDSAAGALWDAGHSDQRRVSRGCNRIIVCGMEALAHTIEFEECADSPSRASANVEVFAFDSIGRITSWRVFRDEVKS
jgi:hypothetical protein